MYESLTRYVFNNNDLADVVYFHPQLNHVYLANYWVTYEEEEIIINHPNGEKLSISFESIYSNRNILWKGKEELGSSFMCYFPDNSQGQDFIIYILDEKKLKNRIETVFLPNIANIQINGSNGLLYSEGGKKEIKSKSNYEIYSFSCSYPELTVGDMD